MTTHDGPPHSPASTEADEVGMSPAEMAARFPRGIAGQDTETMPVVRRRSAWVTTSAVVLLVVGALSALLGVTLVIIGVAFGSAWTEMMGGQPGVPEGADLEAFSAFMTGFMVTFGVVALLWAAGHVAAGIGVLGGRGWARITGMVLAVVGLLFSMLGLLALLGSVGMSAAMLEDPAFREQYGELSAEELTAASLATSLVFGLPFVIGYLVVLVTLIRSGAFFERVGLADSAG